MMNFTEVLKTAHQQNVLGQEKCKRYSTIVSASKKEPKKKVDSNAIKRFLDKREYEEKCKLIQAAKDKKKLLEWRSQDKGSHKRLNAMLKLTKSANKAVVSTEEKQFADTFAVDDDYGYVSKESQALHNKVLHLLNGTSVSKKKKKSYLFDEINRKEKNKKITLKNDYKTSEMKNKVDQVKKNHLNHNKSPGISFQDLLKIASKKQYEPISYENLFPDKVKDYEFDRPMTAKEKEAYLYEKSRKLKTASVGNSNSESVSNPKENLYAISERSVNENVSNVNSPSNNMNSVKLSDISENSNSIHPLVAKTLSIPVIKKTEVSSLTDQSVPSKCQQKHDKNGVNKAVVSFKCKDYQTQKARSESIPNPISLSRSNPVLSTERRLERCKHLPQKKRKLRIDSDEEYDSDLQDFIDDTPLEDEQNVSALIQQMFGYNRKRYQDEVEECMESNYVEVMKEEFKSTKAGILEDLAEIRRKKLAKKKIMC